MANTESGVRPTFGNAIGPSSLGSQIPNSASSVTTIGDVFGDQKPTPLQAPAQGGMQVAQMGPQDQEPQRLPNGEKPIEAKAQDDDDSLSKALAALGSKMPSDQKKALDRINDEDLDKQLKGISEKIGEHPVPLSQFDDKATIAGQPVTDVAKSLKDRFMFVAGKNASGLGSTFDQQKSGWESVYGPDNVTVKNNQIYIRPNGEGPFQKVDQKVFGSVIDFALNHLSQVPGFAANVATQGAVDAAGVPLDAATGGMSTLPVAAAGAAAGGAAQAGTNQLVRSGMNMLSPHPEAEQKTDNISTLADESLKSAGFNLAGWGVMKGMGSALASSTGKSAIEGLKTLLRPELGEMIDAATQKSAQTAIRLELERVTNSMQGLTRTAGGGGSALEGAIGKQTASAVDGVTENLMSTLDAVKDKAVELAGKTGKKVDPSGLMAEMEKTFNKYGIKIVGDTDSAGLAKANSGFAQMPEEGARFALESPNGNRVLSDLVKDYNTLKGISLSNNGQVPPASFYEAIGKYQNLSKFDKARGNFPQEQELFKNLQHAAIGDRQAFESSVFAGSGLPEEKLAADAYGRASTHLNNLAELDGLLKNDSTRQLLVPSILNAAPAKRLSQLTALKNTLGENSEGWGQLRGEIVNRMINDGVDPSTGYLDGKTILQSMKSMGPQVTDVIMSKAEQGSVRQLALQANKISNLADKPNESEQEAIKKMGSALLQFAAKPAQFAVSLFRASNNNKMAVDYLINDGLVDLARQASSKAEQTKILETIRFMDELAGGAKTALIKRAQGSKIPTYLMSAPSVAATSNVMQSAGNAIQSARQPQPVQQDLSMGQ